MQQWAVPQLRSNMVIFNEGFTVKHSLLEFGCKSSAFSCFSWCCCSCCCCCCCCCCTQWLAHIHLIIASIEFVLATMPARRGQCRQLRTSTSVCSGMHLNSTSSELAVALFADIFCQSSPAQCQLSSASAHSMTVVLPQSGSWI